MAKNLKLAFFLGIVVLIVNILAKGGIKDVNPEKENLVGKTIPYIYDKYTVVEGNISPKIDGSCVYNLTFANGDKKTLICDENYKIKESH
jgi:hypothetical protein